MSERKVLTKYYPPDFDPSAIKRVRGVKSDVPKLATVRLMAPFSMKCLNCGEYIYKGRKFNARKEITNESYYSIKIIQFVSPHHPFHPQTPPQYPPLPTKTNPTNQFIKCTRCSSSIQFKTDPKNMDYECVSGAKRNFEPWRAHDNGKIETDEERLDRLEREEAEMDAMEDLEAKMVDAKTEMQIADALDEIRTRNARNERTVKEGGGTVTGVTEKSEAELERERLEQEDEEAARRAFARKPLIEYEDDDEEEEEVVQEAAEPSIVAAAPAKASSEDKDIKEQEVNTNEGATAMPPPPTFKRGVKRKKDFGAALGIKKKAALV